jgi:hypothetical protein
VGTSDLQHVVEDEDTKNEQQYSVAEAAALWEARLGR